MFLLPLAVLLVQFVATALVVGFTPTSSTLRIGVLPLLAICTWVVVSISRQCTGRGPWAAVAGGYSVTYLLQYVSLALFDGRAFETRKIVPDTRFNRLKYGLAAASTFRSNDMPNLPVFSTENPKLIPSRPAFLRWTAFKIMAYYITLDILGLGADAETSMRTFAPQYIPFFSRLSEISMEEFATRLFTTLFTGIGIYCSQDGLQSLFALVAVGVGASEVRSWRPRFGSLHEAYTIRRFWNLTWHQINRHIVSNPTKFIVSNVFKLRRGSIISRYAVLMLHFLISGVLHAFIDLASGIPWLSSGAIRFFCTQSLGIVLEEIVQAMYFMTFGRPPPSTPPTLWGRWLGHAWLALFLSWSVPTWLYPMLYRTRSGVQDSVLPFSPIRAVIAIK